MFQLSYVYTDEFPVYMATKYEINFKLLEINLEFENNV